MAIVTITNKEIKQLQNFEVVCKKCGSNNCEIEIDWASYPSASWNTTTIICKDCHTDETCIEAD